MNPLCANCNGACCRMGNPTTEGPPNTPCCYLDVDTNRCKIYPMRFRVCQDFKPGAQNPMCENARTVHLGE